MTRDQVPDRSQRFSATVSVDRQGRTQVPVPFDPDELWGAKPRHHVTGSIAGCGLRGVLDKAVGGAGLVLGPAWSRGCGPADGATVEVELAPEGPQRGDLAPDVAAALDASPAAAAFFDSLAQFYRKAYLRWIDATRRRPEQRPERIAEMIRLLEEGKKERPGAGTSRA
ncbi:MAG: YdeI/OmpD-associated family protein [Pseudonocardia sp.]